MKQDIVNELTLRAHQERASANIGRTTRAHRDAHEHAARALENLANDIRAGRIELADMLKSEREQIEQSTRGEEFKYGRLEQQERIEAAVKALQS